MFSWKTIIVFLVVILSLVSVRTTCRAETVPPDTDGTTAGAAAAKVKNAWLDNLELHASLSQGYLISNDNNWIAETAAGTFKFNEFAANISYDFTDKFRAGFQLMSRDFGPLMEDKVYLDWALVDYSFRDELGIRLGRLQTPLGLYNESRDVDSARISILLPGGVYPERGRDSVEGINGGALYGNAGLGAAGGVEYFAGYGEIPLFEEAGTAHFLEANGNILDAGSISSLKADRVLALQLAYSPPVEGLRLVGSYAVLKDFHLDARSSLGGVADGAATIEIPEAYTWVGSVEYSRDNFVLAAEYRYLKVEDQDFTFEHAAKGTVSVLSTIPSEGWYLSGSYRFTDWFAAELYYSELYPDSNDRDGTRFTAQGQDDFLAWQKDIALTGRFDLTENWILKTGVTFSDGLAGGFPADYPVAGVASQHWILYQLKVTFVF